MSLDGSLDMGAARRKLLSTIGNTDAEMMRIYKQAAQELGERAAAAKAGGLTRRWSLDMQRSVDERLRQIGKAAYARIADGAAMAAQLPATTTADWVERIFTASGRKLDSSFRTVLTRTSDEALRQVIQGRAYLDGKSLSKRIWTGIGRQQAGIQNLIEQAVAQKKSAAELAKGLKDYLTPEVTDTPDASYYAQRLARTSINHAYALANRETQARNPFAEAMHWELSAEHFERQIYPFGPDICDDYAEHSEGLGVGNWPIADTPLPHANCLCYQYAVTKSLDECASRLTNWLNGGEDAALEESFGTWQAEQSLKSTGAETPTRTNDKAAEQRAALLNEIAGSAEVQAMPNLKRQEYFEGLIDASMSELQKLARK